MNDRSRNPIHVLLVDDDEDDYVIIGRVFKQISDSPFVLDWCPSFDEAKKQIDSRQHDVYLVDYRLGAHNGLELLEYVQPRRRREPFILLTGAGDREIEKKSMKLAAADYLIKGTFKADLLSRTLHYAIERKQIEEERLQQYIELNKTKDEFISVASHQLRTPATGVKQYVGMVLEGFVGAITDEQRTVLTKAYQSNERQLQIVSDLLKVAQIDAGKVKLRKERTNLVPLITDVIKEQADTYRRRQQTVRFITSTDSVMAIIDADRIRMVLENLLDNASKYSDLGRQVIVTLQSDATVVRLAVQDHGVGIDPRQRDKLFEKFSRLANPLSAHVDGTGLGLYWVKKIVDLHGGTIEVGSRLGEGTTFTITLPNDDRASMLETPNPPLKNTPPNAGKEKIS